MFNRLRAWLIALCLVLSALFASGCQTPTSHSTTGWRFEVGRPPTISTPAAISQGAGQMAMFPIGAVATASSKGALLAAEAPECAPCPPTTSLLRRPTLAATAPPCDLGDVCARLERLERRLNSPAPSETLPRPLPGGPSQPQP